jgi:hypothetical protein
MPLGAFVRLLVAKRGFAGPADEAELRALIDRRVHIR